LISRGEGNAFEKTRAKSARRRILSLDGTHWLIENGHREVSKKAAVRYARFFRVDLDWLLTGKGVGTGVTPPPPQDAHPHRSPTLR
jgi:hypothetical protein